MQIQVNTDGNIEGRERLAAYAKETVEDALSRFHERLTRVELHLSDENSQKGGREDKRCVMEARIKGRPAIVVTHQAATMNEALTGAIDKAKRSIESDLEKMQERR